MPNNTPILSLPYPVPADTVDVPRDIKALADKLDTVVTPPASGGLITGATVLDVGLTGQVRAGRQLTLADFTNLGLSAPRGLWNLSDLTDASGNGRSLSNKGGVTFAAGINGAATTAAQFAGSTGQALYIADIGAADPFRITTGSWGCWFRTAKRGTRQVLLSRLGSAGSAAVTTYHLEVNASNVIALIVSDGINAPITSAASDVADDRWHFAVGMFDGTGGRLYVDGVLEAVSAPIGWTLNMTAAVPLNIGGYGADGATAAALPHYGRIDEAFVTADVLTDDQIRCLYAARIPHALGTTPRAVSLNVRRARRGVAYAVTDFTTQPVRLHNFTAGALTDQGSGGVALGNTFPLLMVPVGGADGTASGGYSFSGAHQGLGATDAGLPSALLARSYGCWFKTASTGANMTVLGWGTQVTADVRLVVGATGFVFPCNGADQPTGPFAADGQWHHAVTSEDTTAGDGVKRKLYIDGRLVLGSTAMNTLTLAGAGKFRVGSNQDGSAPFTGQIDGVFVCAYAMTQDEVLRLYLKSGQVLPASPKNAGDHVEAMDATGLLFIGDTLDGQSLVDLGVTA